MAPEMIISLGVIGAVIIAFVTYLVYQIKTKGLRKAAIEFIVMAEANFNDGENIEKFEYVFEAIMALLPGYMRIFITKSAVRTFIQKVFDEIKIALDYQELTDELTNNQGEDDEDDITISEETCTCGQK
jgi:hypothetical protein